MRWSYGDRYNANIEAAVEGANEVDPRGVDERNMVSSVEPAFLQKKASNFLGPLMQLVAS